MRVVSCRFSLVLRLLRPLALGIIAVLIFRYDSHAATGAAVTLLPESTATGRAIDHERDNGGYVSDDVQSEWIPAAFSCVAIFDRRLRDSQTAVGVDILQHAMGFSVAVPDRRDIVQRHSRPPAVAGLADCCRTNSIQGNT